MKRRNLIVLTALLTTASLFASCATSKALTGDKLIKQDNGHLVVQGNIESKEINVNSKIAGKITDIKIKEGDSIKNGQVLITIDNSTYQAKQAQTQAQIEAAAGLKKTAEADKQAAQAVLDKAKNGARAEDLAQVQAKYDLTLKTYNRVKALYDQKYVSQADMDNAQTQLDVAKQLLDETQKGSRPEDIEAAQAQVNKADAAIQAYDGQIKQAQGGLSEVQTYINDTTIAAPADGTITELNVEVGELVSTGMPLLVITNTTAPWVECNVKETDLSKVKLNGEVSVKLAAYPNQQFKGKIVRINEKPDFAVKRATNDNGEFDVLSYGVKVELTNIDKPLHPGMTAMVDFGK